jgi:hypothetical protein
MPRSIGGVLDDAIRLYRESFVASLPLLVMIALIFLIPSVLMSEMTSSIGTSTAPAASPVFWATYVVLLLVYLIFYAALISLIDSVVNERRRPLGEALGIGVARLPKILGASILFGLAVMIGCLLLLIPGIYIWGIFQLVFIPLVIEGAGVSASFGISNRLVTGHWWRTVTLTTVAIIIMVVFSMLGGLLVALLVAIARPGTMVALLINQIVSTIVNVFVVSWLPCVLLSIYYDLKLRREGDDLATRVDALAAR